MEATELTIIKVGTNSLLNTSDIGHQLNSINIEKVAGEVNELRELGHAVMIVSSGAITAGMMEDGRVRTGEESIAAQQRYAAIGWPYLVSEWAANITGNTASVLLDAHSMHDELSWNSTRSLLRECWGAGDVVLVNNNDAVSTSEIAYTDNDELASAIVIRVAREAIFEAINLVMLTDTDGVIRGFGTPAAELVRTVAPGESALQYCETATSANSVGSMASKVAGLERAREHRVSGFIGNVEASVAEIMLGHSGTSFAL